MAKARGRVAGGMVSPGVPIPFPVRPGPSVSSLPRGQGTGGTRSPSAHGAAAGWVRCPGPRPAPGSPYRVLKSSSTCFRKGRITSPWLSGRQKAACWASPGAAGPRFAAHVPALPAPRMTLHWDLGMREGRGRGDSRKATSSEMAPPDGSTISELNCLLLKPGLRCKDVEDSAA